MTAKWMNPKVRPPPKVRPLLGPTTSWTESKTPGLTFRREVYDGHRLVLGAVRAGDRTHVLSGACVFPFTELRDDVTVGRESLVMKGETVPARTWLAGVPATAVDHATHRAFAPFSGGGVQRDLEAP